jgi:hypothetical protein
MRFSVRVIFVCPAFMLARGDSCGFALASAKGRDESEDSFKKRYSAPAPT